MPKYFRRNFAKCRIRERSAAAKVLNEYMAHAHTIHPSGHVKEYHWNALNPIRALSPEDSIPTLLLAYEHFLWLFEDSNVKQQHGDSVTYASGLDFAIQVLARKPGLKFSNDQLARLVRAYLTHPHPTPCLPPQIIVGLIFETSRKARTGARTRSGERWAFTSSRHPAAQLESGRLGSNAEGDAGENREGRGSPVILQPSP